MAQATLGDPGDPSALWKTPGRPWETPGEALGDPGEKENTSVWGRAPVS